MKMVENDAEVARRVEDIGYDNIDGLLANARELRLNIDHSDFEKVKDEMLKKSQELSDTEMTSVSGGWFFPLRRYRGGDQEQIFPWKSVLTLTG